KLTMVPKSSAGPPLLQLSLGPICYCLQMASILLELLCKPVVFVHRLCSLVYSRHNLDERTPSDVTGRRMFDPFDEYRIPKLVRAIVTEIEFPIHLREG